MKKILSLSLVAVMLIISLAGCGCKHQWADATCQTPKTCTSCGETEGEVLSHNFGEATCAAPSTCSGCSTTQGEPLSHSFGEATCAAPSTCSSCGATQGEPLSHTLTEANYQEAPLCSVCGATDGAPLTAGFEKLQINLRYVELNTPVTLTINGAQYTYTVLSHTSEEAEDGYVWHTLKTKLELQEGQPYPGRNVYCYADFADYYTPEEQTASVSYVDSDTLLSLSFTANYKGQEYTECLMQLEDSYLDPQRTAWTYSETTSFKLPKGYDGLLLAMGDARLMENGSYTSLWQNFYNNENTVVYRIK